MTEISFDEAVVAAVLHHMNDEHNDDSLVIVRAMADSDASAANMTDLDAKAGYWSYQVGEEQKEARIEWTIDVQARPDIRKAVVFLYRAACEKLGIEFREH